MLGPARVELDRDHAPGAPCQLGGQTAAAGAEIEHEVVRTNTSVADDLRGERLRAKEVLTTCAVRPARTSRAPLGHGPSP